jgi:Helix-turn-helix domain
MISEKLKLMPQPTKPSDCPPTKRNLLTPVEAAMLLHMDHRTLIRWARVGYVPAHPLGEGRRRLWRFFEDELLAWVGSQSNVCDQRLRSAA